MVVIIDIVVIYGYIYETVSVEIGNASVTSSVLSSARSKVQLASPMCYNYRRFDMPLPVPSDPLCGYVPPEWSSYRLTVIRTQNATPPRHVHNRDHGF